MANTRSITDWIYKGGYSRLVAWRDDTGEALRTSVVRPVAFAPDYTYRMNAKGQRGLVGKARAVAPEVASEKQVRAIRAWEAEGGVEIRAVLLSRGDGRHYMWEEPTPVLYEPFDGLPGSLTGDRLLLDSAKYAAAVYEDNNLLAPLPLIEGGSWAYHSDTGDNPDPEYVTDGNGNRAVELTAAIGETVTLYVDRVLPVPGLDLWAAVSLANVLDSAYGGNVYISARPLNYAELGAPFEGLPDDDGNLGFERTKTEVYIDGNGTGVVPFVMPTNQKNSLWAVRIALRFDNSGGSVAQTVRLSLPALLTREPEAVEEPVQPGAPVAAFGAGNVHISNLPPTVAHPTWDGELGDRLDAIEAIGGTIARIPIDLDFFQGVPDGLADVLDACVAHAPPFRLLIEAGSAAAGTYAAFAALSQSDVEDAADEFYALWQTYGDAAIYGFGGPNEIDIALNNVPRDADGTTTTRDAHRAAIVERFIWWAKRMRTNGYAGPIATGGIGHPEFPAQYEYAYTPFVEYLGYPEPVSGVGAGGNTVGSVDRPLTALDFHPYRNAGYFTIYHRAVSDLYPFGYRAVLTETITGLLDGILSDLGAPADTPMLCSEINVQDYAADSGHPFFKDPDTLVHDSNAAHAARQALLISAASDARVRYVGVFGLWTPKDWYLIDPEGDSGASCLNAVEVVQEAQA